MSLKVDRLELEIIINNDQSRKRMRELNDDALQIQKSMKKMVEGSDEWVAATKRLNSVKQEYDKILDSIGLMGLSLGELRKKQNEFKMVVNQMPTNHPAYAKYKQTLDEITARITELSGKSKAISGGLGGGLIGKILGVAGGMSIFSMVSSGFSKINALANENIAIHEKLEIATRQVKAAFTAMIGTLVSGDFSNFFSNMGTAAKYAKDLVEQEEKLNYLTLQTGLKNAKLRAEATKLYEIIFSTTDVNKRAEAVDKYMSLMKKVFDNDKKVADQQHGNAVIAYNAATTHIKLTAEEAMEIAKMEPGMIGFYMRYNEALKKKQDAEYQASQTSNETRKALYESQASAANTEITNMEKTAGFSKKVSDNMKLFMQIGGEVEGHIPKVVRGLMEHEKAIFDISTAYEQETKQIQRYGANIDKQAAADAEKRLKEIEKFQNDYDRMMEEAKSIEKMNFAEKLSQTEQEIKTVNEKYNTEIKKLQQFLKEKDKLLNPSQKQEINTQIGNLDTTRQAQVNQVLVQAEKDFAEKVKQIHENLRVARMAITEREVYDINKKYDDLQKEIVDAIQYRYEEEIRLANGDKDKISLAEQNKADATLKIQGDMNALSTARKEETDKARRDGDIRFEEELKGLKLKADKDLATGKDKIQQEVNLKYKKLLDENLKDEQKTLEIKAQMVAEVNDRIAELTKQTYAKLTKDIESTVNSFAGNVEQMWNVSNQTQNRKDQEALNDYEKTINNRKKINDKELADGIISQQEHDAEEIRLTEALAAEKKRIAIEAAEREARSAEMMILLKEAVAIAAAITLAVTSSSTWVEAIIAIVADVAAVVIEFASANDKLSAAKSAQYAKGKYDVIGEDDGRTYRDVPFIGTPRTGYYSKTFLGSEHGGELVIDHPTTENLMMNYPEVIRAIKYASTGVVPQYAGGKYYETNSGSPGGLGVAMLHPDSLAELKRLNDHLDKGLYAKMVFDDFRRAQKKIDDIESSASNN